MYCFSASGFCYMINTGTLLRYPAVAMCHGDPVALILNDQTPLCAAVQITDGVEVGVGKLITLLLGNYRVGQPASFPQS